jgi:acetoacetyl-CoA reductase
MAKRIAVVTGGMGGIGEAICKELYQNNFHVVAGYHRGGNHEAAKQWQDKQKKAGFEFEIGYVDVTDFELCIALANKVEKEIGPIDVLVNNAGITRDNACCKMSKEDWDTVINTDLNSIFYMTRAVVPLMKERHYGRIINISSINGQRGQYGQVNYAAAKAGIHGFTKALAIEMAKHGVTVNTVSPGYVATEMIMSVSAEIRAKILAEIPLGRFAEPEEIAHVVVFLSEERNQYITGANIAINGGQYML